MGIIDTYTIPFDGLKLGQHIFEFKATHEFFEAFENSVITDGDFKIELSLFKEEDMLLLDFDIDGIVKTSCDRCGDNLEVPMSFDNKTIIKFSNYPSLTDEIIVLSENAYEWNAAQLIYELITVQYPQRNVHDKNSCNKERINELEKLKPGHDKREDPRWQQLEKLKEKL